MKKTILYIISTVIILSACNTNTTPGAATAQAEQEDTLAFQSGYADVNGIKMYYEIYGEGEPLVLLHGGGSTIQTTFGRALPLLAKNRKLIAVELQAHGRTSDRDQDLSFEQDADDVAVLLKTLNISKADFLGFSNGATTVMQIAIRHPEVIGKLVLGSVLAKRNGVPPVFWDFMKHASVVNMPKELKEAYLAVTPDTAGLRVMHDRDAKRMLNFKDIPDERISAIKAPTLIIIADKDVITPEHGIALNRLMKNSSLAIIPGVHGEYIGEITTVTLHSKEEEFVVPMIDRFLEKEEKQEAED